MCLLIEHRRQRADAQHQDGRRDAGDRRVLLCAAGRVVVDAVAADAARRDRCPDGYQVPRPNQQVHLRLLGALEGVLLEGDPHQPDERADAADHALDALQHEMRRRHALEPLVLLGRRHVLRRHDDRRHHRLRRHRLRRQHRLRRHDDRSRLGRPFDEEGAAGRRSGRDRHAHLLAAEVDRHLVAGAGARRHGHGELAHVNSSRLRAVGRCHCS